VKSASRRLVSFVTRPLYLAAFVLTACSMAAAVAATAKLHDPDVWWVAAAGREMLASARIPRENLFSFTEPHHAWLMHEWLLAPPYALGLERLGPAFLVFLGLFVSSAGLLFILKGTVGRARHGGAGLALALVSVLFFSGRLLSARPTGVALLFPLALCVVAFAPRLSVGGALLSVAIELVWTNAHGSFPLGLVLLAVAWLDADADRRLRLGTSVAALLVTAVNPGGLALHGFVFRYALGDAGIYRTIHGQIHEFRSVLGAWGSTVDAVDLVGLALVLALSASASFVARHRVRASLCLLLLIGACAQARNVGLAGLLGCQLMVPWVDELWERFCLVPAEEAPTPLVSYRWLLAPPLALGFGLFLFSTARRPAGALLARGPALLRGLHSVREGSHLYVPFSEAGAAIWYGFPRGVRVFFDSRNDCYSPETFRSFLLLGERGTPKPVALQILARSHTDAVLIPTGHPLSFLGDETGWVRQFAEGSWSLYGRTLHPSSLGWMEQENHR
jgi:hypothetical protein